MRAGGLARGDGAAPDADALAYFHLGESGEGRVSFGSSAFERGAQVFTDVVFEGEDGVELRAQSLRLAGARETSEGAVFDALEIAGLSAEDGADTFTIDRVLVEQPNALLASLIAQMLSAEGVDEDADWGKLSDYAFDTLALEGLQARGDGGEVALETLRFSALRQGGLGGFALEDLAGSGEADGSGVAFTLASWRASGLDLSGVDSFADIEIDDEQAVQRAITESGFNDPFRKRYDSYDLSGVDIDVDGVLISLDSVSGEARQTRVGVETDETLRGLTVAFDDSRELGAQALAGLALLGYDRIEINGEFVALADQVNDRLTTDAYSLRAEDALALELDYDIGGVQSYLRTATKLGMNMSANPSPDELAALFGPLVVNGFELRLIDDSFVDRALQATAASQGSTPEQVREQMVAVMAIGTLMAPPGPAQVLVADAITAASKFLETPGTLTIAIEPAEPVSVAALMAAFEAEDYDQALGMMNIRIEAE